MEGNTTEDMHQWHRYRGPVWRYARLVGSSPPITVKALTSAGLTIAITEAEGQLPNYWQQELGRRHTS